MKTQMIGTNSPYYERQHIAEKRQGENTNGLHYKKLDIRRAVRQLPSDRDSRDNRTILRHRGLPARDPDVAHKESRIVRPGARQTFDIHLNDIRDSKEANTPQTAPRKEQDRERCNTDSITHVKTMTLNTSSRASSRRTPQSTLQSSSTNSESRRDRSALPSFWTERTSAESPPRMEHRATGSTASCDHRSDRWLKISTLYRSGSHDHRDGQENEPEVVEGVWVEPKRYYQTRNRGKTPREVPSNQYRLSFRGRKNPGRSEKRTYGE